MQDFIPALKDTMTKEEAKQVNPLVLAFVGDAVQTLYVRTRCVFFSSQKAGALHKTVSQEINAQAQAAAAHSLIPLFSEEELEVFKRARNSKSATSAKNASITDYRQASGLEAVFGYLYLIGNHERLSFLLEKGRA